MAKLRAGLLGFGLLVAFAQAAAAQDSEPKLTVNGFLTQGFGRSDTEPVLGIPTNITTDYRTAALQLRYAIDAKSELVFQLSHRRVGTSELNVFEGPVELDWAFYRHRLGPVQLRAGRFPLPRGLYNEMRDVGTVIPLFRAPYVLYEDGTEAVDGIGLANVLNVGEWSLESHVFAGGAEYRAVYQTPDGPFPYKERVEKSAGGQLWLSTPIEGLRTGFAVMGWKNEAGADRDYDVMWISSLDADFDRYMLRAEHLHILANGANVWASYAHARFKATQSLHVIAQIETKDLELSGDYGVPRHRVMTDAAVGVSYSLNPNLVFKFETHVAEGYAFDRYVDAAGPNASTRYGIASVSVSF